MNSRKRRAVSTAVGVLILWVRALLASYPTTSGLLAAPGVYPQMASDVPLNLSSLIVGDQLNEWSLTSGLLY